MKDAVKMTFSQFLTRTVAQKDVSLVIAKDDKEFKEFESLLGGEGFQVVTTVVDLVNSLEDVSKDTKFYVVPTKENIKSFYDFLVQYPTGQVETFDSAEMKSKILHPTYDNSAIIFLVSQEGVSEFQSNNFALLQYAGLTFQN